MRTTTIIAAVMLVGSASAVADESTGACMEGGKAAFGRYVGDWKIEDQALQQDGVTWQPAKGARWIFECIGDGVAVQDFWHPNGGGYGTNLRVYNEDTGKWEIVWAARQQKGLMRIAAELQDDGRVVMDIVSPPTPQPRRIIFFPPDDGGWDWVQEWSFDDGETWTPVYRIRATPWEDN